MRLLTLAAFAVLAACSRPDPAALHLQACVAGDAGACAMVSRMTRAEAAQWPATPAMSPSTGAAALALGAQLLIPQTAAAPVVLNCTSHTAGIYRHVQCF